MGKALILYLCGEMTYTASWKGGKSKKRFIFWKKKIGVFVSPTNKEFVIYEGGVLKSMSVNVTQFLVGPPL